jgi:hypothetical protein
MSSYAALPSNKRMQRTGQVPRFSGHAELTFRSVECQDQDEEEVVEPKVTHHDAY